MCKSHIKSIFIKLTMTRFWPLLAELTTAVCVTGVVVGGAAVAVTAGVVPANWTKFPFKFITVNQIYISYLADKTIRNITLILWHFRILELTIVTQTCITWTTYSVCHYRTKSNHQPLFVT